MSAKSFTSFLGGYSIFLGPIAGILLSDYFILRILSHIVAFTLALFPNLPGFAGKVNSHHHVPVGAMYLFSVVWPLGVVVASVLYVTFSFFPPLIEKKDGQATFTSHDDNLADEKDEKENSATVHIQEV